MVDSHGRFVWYELITTDIKAASAFYAEVVGWSVHDASTPGLSYTSLVAGKTRVGGLMELPEEASKRGATPRWVGYVSVGDIDVTADRVRRLGGMVFVPPTDSNIGRISIVADPQTANLALVKGLKAGPQRSAELGTAGAVGWHELLAADGEKAFAFYSELFGWQKADFESAATEGFQRFSVAGQTIGGMFTKPKTEPVPFWLYYFNIDDIDAAAKRVETSGGKVYAKPLESPGGNWIAQCRDPQGAAFGLQGRRNQAGIGWSTEWDGFSSKGKLVTKPRD